MLTILSHSRGNVGAKRKEEEVKILKPFTVKKGQSLIFKIISLN